MRDGVRPRLLLLALAAAAFWPVWAWYAGRVASSGEEAWGVASLATALFLLLKTDSDAAEPIGARRPRLGAAALLVALYAATWPFLPALGRAAVAVTALGCAAHALFGRGRPPAAAWALLPLSLPVVATLQFYLGYPLRVATAAAAAGMIRLTGFAVVRDGTAIDWNGTPVLVDGPCSGVRMLWVGLYLALALSGVCRLSAARTALAAAVALCAVLAGNALRASALFYTETGVVAAPAWAHEGVGLVAFGLTAALVAAGVRRVHPRRPLAVRPEPPRPAGREVAC